MSLWEYANPARFMALSARILPALTIGAAVLLLSGLIWGFFFTPADYKQGSTVKIIFLHVPTALMAINAWLMMLVASLIWLIRRHHVSALAAKAAAPIGMTMTLIALATGAIWGEPMWGTYWAWDPRLTSFMILLIIYFGYLALWEAIGDKDAAPTIGTQFLQQIYSSLEPNARFRRVHLLDTRHDWPELHSSNAPLVITLATYKVS